MSSHDNFPDTRSARGSPAPTISAEYAWFAHAWQHAPFATAVVSGENHQLVFANPACENFCSASSGELQDSLVGRTAASTFPEASATAIVAMLDNVRLSGAPGEVVVQRGPAASSETWHCSAWPLDLPMKLREHGGHESLHANDPIALSIDSTSNPELTLSRYRMLTEMVLLSALREETRADSASAALLVVEDSYAARGRLLAEISHEFRTPLHAVGGYVDLLSLGLRGPVTHEQSSALEKIKMGVAHLVDLTTTLLDHITIEEGRVLYRIAVFSAEKIVHDAVGLMAREAESKHVALTVLPGDPQLAMRADESRVSQVLINLIANALKFTEPGGSVTLQCRTDDQGTVSIVVQDTGSGIAEHSLLHIFDPFVQVGHRLRSRHSGVGLGLAISRDLARGMGGDITVQSTLGVGSTFTVTMPSATIDDILPAAYTARHTDHGSN